MFALYVICITFTSQEKISIQHTHPFLTRPAYKTSRNLTSKYDCSTKMLARRSQTRLVLILSLAISLNSEIISAYRQSFNVQRNYQDVFENPDCELDSQTTCPKSCERYHASCLQESRGDSCKSCTCSGEIETFSFIRGNATGRCMTAKKMADYPGIVDIVIDQCLN